MSVVMSSSMRTPWMAAIFALFLIWSLYTIDMPSMTSAGSAFYEDMIESQAEAIEAAARLALGADLPAHQEAASESNSAEVIISGLGAQLPEDASVEVVDIPLQGISELPLILYAYSESETARVNIEFFIRHGLHAAADFVFILNGPTDIASMIPKEANIRIVQRENDCYDIGAYAEVLTKGDLYKGYKRFIMLNASIRGPFLPYWAKGCWSDMYLGRITDEVKLVGMTANCWPTFHVQSMIWATDITGLETLLHPTPSALAAYARDPPKSAAKDEDLVELARDPPQKPGINACFHNWITAVTAEVGATALIKAAGYKVDVMMSAYHGIQAFEEVCDSSENADVLWEKEYFGTNVHPFETVFIKSNRDIDPVGLEDHTAWTNGRGYSSYQFCKAMESPWIAGASV